MNSLQKSTVRSAMVLAWFAAFAVSTPAAETGKRYLEAAGGYSFCPPKDWVMKEMPGLKYKLAIGEASGGFAPNINVVDEAFDGSVADYVKASLETVSKVFKGFKKLGQSNFKTDSGVKGIRLQTESEQGNLRLRQTFFFLEGKGKTKLVVTCSALAETGQKLDAVFEDSLKTFALEK
jgi:hypothetical protein